MENIAQLKEELKTAYDHDQQHAPWRSFWAPMENFSTGFFNDMLEWLGEDGCSFNAVIHANAPVLSNTSYQPQGFNNSEGGVGEARRHLKGKCKLALTTGGESQARR